MGKREFIDYGELDWLEPEDFYSGNWSIYNPKILADDGDYYTVVISGDKTELRYTIV